MTQTTTNETTVIIGAGLAGLICGNILAGRGHDVTLVESGETPGGRAKTAVDEQGYHVNLGPHAMYDEGALAAQLEALDIEVSGGAPEGAMYGLRGDTLGRLPDGPWAMLTTGLLGFGGKFGLMSVMGELQGGPGPEAVGQSASEWLDAHVDRREVREVVAAFIRLATYAADLDRLPADIMLDALDTSLAGVTYVDGGWQTIVDQLVERLREAGGTVRTGEAVVGVAETEGGRFSVDIRGRETRLASRVVVATPPSACRRILDDRAARAAGLPDAPRPVEAACLDLALEGLPRSDRPLGLGLETPTYISDHGPYADIAPDGASVVHAARYLRGDEASSPEAMRADIEGALDTLQPGWRDQVVDSRFLSRIPVVSHMPKPREGGYRGRPSPVVESVDGLYLAGDWVGETGWLSNASAASARQVADAITERESEVRKGFGQKTRATV